MTAPVEERLTASEANRIAFAGREITSCCHESFLSRRIPLVIGRGENGPMPVFLREALVAENLTHTPPADREETNATNYCAPYW